MTCSAAVTRGIRQRIRQFRHKRRQSSKALRGLDLGRILAALHCAQGLVWRDLLKRLAREVPGPSLGRIAPNPRKWGRQEPEDPYGRRRAPVEILDKKGWLPLATSCGHFPSVRRFTRWPK